MKNVIIASVLSLFLFASCDTGYEVGDIAPQNDARFIYVSIDDNYVGWKSQRSFYDHSAKVVTVEYLENSIKSGKDLSAFIVYTAPVFGATFSPEGGKEEDWSLGERTYTITSKDGTTTNDYRIQLVEVAAF